MSVIEKFTEFLNTLTMKYQLGNKCWINTVVMIQSVPHCLLMIILLPEYYYVPIRKIKLFCCMFLIFYFCVPICIVQRIDMDFMSMHK